MSTRQMLECMKQELENKLSEQELREQVPQIIFSAEPELAEFSFSAWKLAYRHIKHYPGAPQSPLMDEAFAPDRIWIWDTCFMALFCKYAAHVFPGVESLDNFYALMLDHSASPLKIHVPDNPPLFAWAEFENYRMTGNRERLEKIFFHRKYPQRMFELFESFKFGQKFNYMTSPFPVQWEKTARGYHWTGGRSGMDNTPRGDFGCEIADNNRRYHEVLFVDAAAQQALAAIIIFEVTHEEIFQKKYEELATLINKYYWASEDKCYYDIKATAPYEHVKVMTPASYWPFLAGIASPEQVAAMAQHVLNPDELGGIVPFPSVARNSPHFDPARGYWRGGVWLPVAYMAIKSLEKYGYVELADVLGERLVKHQLQTWQKFAPHTIWEAYSPTAAEPSTRKHNSSSPRCKPDFCEWSALGPINLMIENVLGIKADATERTVEWRIHHQFHHGVKNLRVNNIRVDLLFDEGGIVSVKTDGDFTLNINGRTWRCRSGSMAERLY